MIIMIYNSLTDLDPLPESNIDIFFIPGTVLNTTHTHTQTDRALFASAILYILTIYTLAVVPMVFNCL